MSLAMLASSKPREDDRMGGALLGEPGVFFGFVDAPGADVISSEPAIDGEVGWPFT